MTIPLVDLKAQYQSIKEEIDHVIQDVLTSGNFIMGKYLEKFEKHFARYNGCKYAIGVANGTDALIIALEALGIGEGDEVITSPLTFFATVEAIARVGARPVFADIDPYTLNINPQEIEKKISNHTKAIVPVHIYGNPAKMDTIMEIARKYSLYVVEDACQAVGATFKGKKVGTFGDAGCFSFFPSKNLGCCGDGGAIITNNEKVAAMARALRVHGGGKAGQSAYKLFDRFMEEEKCDKYHNYLIAFNSRLDELQAAILYVKLKYLDRWNGLRRQIAQYYDQRLQEYPFQLPREEEGALAVYHLYTLMHQKRDYIIEHLSSKGIEARVYYPVPQHLQKALRYLDYKQGDFNIAEGVCRKAFSIPIYPELSRKEQDYIIHALIDSIS